MLLTPHILVGAAIITFVQNPILGLIFVLLSHYFLDIFPQTEYTIKTIQAGQWSRALPDFLKVFSDIALGLMVVFLLKGFSLLILIAGVVSCFPDALTLLHYIVPANKLLKKHHKDSEITIALITLIALPLFAGNARALSVPWKVHADAVVGLAQTCDHGLPVVPTSHESVKKDDR